MMKELAVKNHSAADQYIGIPVVIDTDGFERKSSCSRHKYILIMSLIAIMSMGISASTVMYMHYRHLDQKDEIVYCMPCTKSMKQPIFADYMWEDKFGKCCIKSCDKEKISAVLELMVEKHITQEQHDSDRGHSISLNDINFGSNIGAHKHLEFDIPYEYHALPDFSRNSCPLNISTTNDYLEYSNEVQLNRTGIKIIHSGLYYVYMSIYFLPDSAQACKEFEKQTFGGYLMRKTSRREKPDVLLSTEHTCCPDCVYNKESGYSGGVFYLQKGDMIQVTVSAYDIIYVSRDITFMGLTMMGTPKDNNDV